VPPDSVAAADSPPVAAGGVGSFLGAASASEAPAQASAAVGGDRGAADDAAGPPAVVEEAGWGPDLSAGDLPEGTEVVAGR
jgi:hypothetical protein